MDSTQRGLRGVGQGRKGELSGLTKGGRGGRLDVGAVNARAKVKDQVWVSSLSEEGKGESKK